jgi:hypothetical protein
MNTRYSTYIYRREELYKTKFHRFKGLFFSKERAKKYNEFLCCGCFEL